MLKYETEEGANDKKEIIRERICIKCQKECSTKAQLPIAGKRVSGANQNNWGNGRTKGM